MDTKSHNILNIIRKNIENITVQSLMKRVGIAYFQGL